MNTPYTFIRQALERAFIDLAEAVDSGKVITPGKGRIYMSGMPLGIFMAQDFMLTIWDEYARELLRWLFLNVSRQNPDWKALRQSVARIL